MFTIIVFVTLALAGALGALAYLWNFARASRRDALFTPASGAGARHARWVTGMYVRDYGGEGEIRDRYPPETGGYPQEIGRYPRETRPYSREAGPALGAGRPEEDDRARGDQLVGR